MLCHLRQDLKILFVLHEAPLRLFLHPVEVPLDGSSAFWHINHSSGHCLVRKLVKVCSAHNSDHEDVKQNQTHCWSWGTPLVTHPFVPLPTGPSHSVCFQPTLLSSPPACTSTVSIKNLVAQCPKFYWHQGRQYPLLSSPLPRLNQHDSTDSFSIHNLHT